MGAKTGIARYFFTGRPTANQHQTWKDIYVTYWKSHYKPALFLANAYFIYSLLAGENRSEGKLPMTLVVISMIAWVVTPIAFSPFSRWKLIAQDATEFNGFITGHAGTDETEIPEVISRGKKGTARSLYECGLAEELTVWSEQHFLMLTMSCLIQAAIGVYLITVCPAEILDYLPVYVCVLSFSWVVVLGYFTAGLNNVFLVFSFLMWIVAIPFGHYVIGDRAHSPNWTARVPEYAISLTIFFFFLDLAKSFVLIACRAIFCLCPCRNRDQKKADRRLHECIRVCFVYFFVHQVQTIEAYIILCVNMAVAALTATLDRVFFNVHTWWLLNDEMARTKHGESYMEKNATFFELDALRPGFGSDVWSSSDSEFEDEIPDSLVRSWA